MLNEEEEDDVSFYVQKNESTMLKSVSGLNTYGNLADERIKTNRERPTSNRFFFSISIINRNHSFFFFINNLSNIFIIKSSDNG